MPVDFSVIIPSRNRPVLLRKAIDSALHQTHRSVEVIVVNDGSDGDNATKYRDMASELAGRVRFFDLISTTTGHGQSYAINIGVAKAEGTHVCFLDDDDYWTDMEHLARAAKIIGGSERDVDVYLTNQHAYLNDTRRTENVWIEGLLEQVRRPLSANRFGAYEITVADLMQCSGFGHLNTTMVRRDLFTSIGGLDNRIRYECDRDFFLRIIDAATTILYVPDVVSRHNIPDASAKSSMSTAISAVEKHVEQLRVLDKAILFTRHPEIRAHGRKHKVFALKKIATILHEQNERENASYYAREASVTGFNIKWFLFTLYLSLRRFI